MRYTRAIAAVVCMFFCAGKGLFMFIERNPSRQPFAGSSRPLDERP